MAAQHVGLSPTQPGMATSPHTYPAQQPGLSPASAAPPSAHPCQPVSPVRLNFDGAAALNGNQNVSQPQMVNVGQPQLGAVNLTQPAGLAPWPQTHGHIGQPGMPVHQKPPTVWATQPQQLASPVQAMEPTASIHQAATQLGAPACVMQPAHQTAGQPQQLGMSVSVMQPAHQTAGQPQQLGTPGQPQQLSTPASVMQPAHQTAGQSQQFRTSACAKQPAQQTAGQQQQLGTPVRATQPAAVTHAGQLSAPVRLTQPISPTLGTPAGMMDSQSPSTVQTTGVVPPLPKLGASSKARAAPQSQAHAPQVQEPSWASPWSQNDGATDAWMGGGWPSDANWPCDDWTHGADAQQAKFLDLMTLSFTVIVLVSDLCQILVLIQLHVALVGFCRSLVATIATIVVAGGRSSGEPQAQADAHHVSCERQAP